MDGAGGYVDHDFTAEFYDHIPVYSSRRDVEFYLSLAAECNGEMLELACGTGRITLPVARAGMTVTGLDISPHMLKVFNRKLADEPHDVKRRVTVVKGDMSNFSLGRTFDLIIIPFRSFQILTTVEMQLRCLEAVRAHLTDTGRVVLDLFNPSIKLLFLTPEGELRNEGETFELPDGRKVERAFTQRDRDYFDQSFTADLIHYVTWPDGRKERLVQSFRMRYLFRWEAEHLLARCGFKVEHVYADHQRSPFGSKDPGELIMVARKS